MEPQLHAASVQRPHAQPCSDGLQGGVPMHNPARAASVRKPRAKPCSDGLQDDIPTHSPAQAASVRKPCAKPCSDGLQDGVQRRLGLRERRGRLLLVLLAQRKVQLIRLRT